MMFGAAETLARSAAGVGKALNPALVNAMRKGGWL